MTCTEPSPGHHDSVPPVERARQVLTSVNGVPLLTGNRIDLLRNGEEIFPAMLAAIDEAQHSVDFLTFVYWSGEIARRFAEAIARSARRGVRVRVLLDAVGARPIDQSLLDRMQDAGADVRRFRPPSLLHPIASAHRTHRKVLVCDECVAFTGGVGIADEWVGDGRTDGSWRETHARITGPAVAALRAAFLDNWVEEEPSLFDPAVDRFPEQPAVGDVDVQVIKGGAEPGWNDISMTVRALLELASSRIRITTAYFVPDDDMQGRLVEAARRGVDVQLLLPGPDADKRFVQLAGEARYRELLDAGVELWCYQPSMLHAKTLTVDGSISVLGSANFNHRSTSLDEEVNLVVFDERCAAELDRDFDRDLQYADRLDLARWRRRSLPQRAMERAMHLLRPWM